jgi:PD-(D/E)XK nuclease superfamily
VTDGLDIPAYLRRNKDNSMPEFVSRPLVYSFTLLKTADSCMYKAYRMYVKKDVPFFETPEMKWGNDVHTAMEHRLGGKPLPAEMRHWEPIVAAYAERKAQPERKLGVTRDGKPTDFFGTGVFLRGKIDVTMMHGTAAFLPDYKTGNSKYEDAFELEIQAVMLHAAYPHLTRITGCYVWLKENRIGQTHDLSDTRSTWAKVHTKVEAIEDAMKEGDWPKNKTPLCGWCGVLDCEFNTVAQRTK